MPPGERSVQKESMEDKTSHSLPADIDANGVVRSTRDLPPAHYTFQIKNFSLLFETRGKKCESAQFEVGGYQWRLVLRTNGKRNSNVNSHVSLHLAIENTNNLSLGWEVNVNFRFFVFDQIRDKYLCIQDAYGSVRRFHKLKTEWGFAQLLSFDTLNDPSNGYLVDDNCIFGVEVFVIKWTGIVECLSMMVNQPRSYFTWRIDRFVELKEEFYLSDIFIVEGRKWRLKLYPRGTRSAADKFLSLFLQLDNSEILPPNRKLYAEYNLRIRDQVNNNHREKTANNSFRLGEDFGYLEFLSLRDIKDTSNGYLVGDDLFIECKIDLIL